MDNETKYLLAKENNKYFIKIIGTARYTNCADFSHFISELFKDDTVADILVDLRETDFLDSTSLGILAKMAGFIFSKFERKMTVISTHPDINDLLINTGFDQIMFIVDQPEYFVSHLNEITELGDVEKNMAKMMLEAHKALMDISDENKKEFRTVVEMLTAEINKTEG